MFILRGLEIETISSYSDINQRKCEFIKNCIDKYLLDHKNYSFQQFSDESNVPHTTLKRIISLSGNPKPETVIKILNTIGADKLLIQYMTEYHPEIAGLINSKTTHNQEYTYVENENSKYFTSEDYFLILNLASSASGATSEEISYNLGAVGLERLNHLVDIGLVIESKGGIFFGKTQDFKLSFSDTKKRIQMSLNHYRLNEAGSINNWMSLQTESVNQDGLYALKKLSQKHFNERKDQIYNNPMYKGNIKHFSACISSTFLPYIENGGIQ